MSPLKANNSILKEISDNEEEEISLNSKKTMTRMMKEIKKETISKL
jgi:hypothetical protein